MRIILLCVLSVLTCAAVVLYCMEMNPHDFDESECVSCHRLDESGKVVQTEEQLGYACRNCHSALFEESYIHPIGVRPKRAEVPSDLPLSRDGEITCNTCHDVHSPAKTPYGTRSYYLRRLDRGRAFCAACHRGSTFGVQGHEEALGEAHFRSKYIVVDPSQEIDPMSKNCISCHDGSYATSVIINAGIWSHSRSLLKNDMGSHPIGVDYETARMKPGRKTDLKPMSAVDRRIRFFNGKVGCGTCHNPFSTRSKQLVMSNRESMLCRACHDIVR